MDLPSYIILPMNIVSAAKFICIFVVDKVDILITIRIHTGYCTVHYRTGYCIACGPFLQIQTVRAVLRVREEIGGHAHPSKQLGREGLRVAAGLVPQVHGRATRDTAAAGLVTGWAQAARAGGAAQYGCRAARARVQDDEWTCPVCPPTWTIRSTLSDIWSSSSSRRHWSASDQGMLLLLGYWVLLFFTLYLYCLVY